MLTAQAGLRRRYGGVAGQGGDGHQGRGAGLGAVRPAESSGGAPNILYVVWDDVGYGAMDVNGGPIETPTLRRIADRGVRFTNFHTTALCSPTRSSLLNGRNATSNNMACITEGASGFPASLPASRSRTA